ncbi:hypothetical protein DPMN_061074 [Dreissena polymorpha]|uniref:Uncharacterized protein n=1 Tax=Dreissena polymorpha TaxID=45954 RepID=A0A9D4C6C5_DREPO|nr:hypothetical protein DPMN_061074 [Dreissena polymorpha]
MNTALKHKYIVFGTVSADFEIKKTIKEELKKYEVLGDLEFTEKEEYDKIEGVANKAFEKDDSSLGISKESKRQESTVYKDISRGSVMYDDSNVKQTLSGKKYANVDMKAQAAKYKKKDEKTDPSVSSEENPPPVPPRSSLKLKSKESGNSFSRCCCNLI